MPKNSISCDLWLALGERLTYRHMDGLPFPIPPPPAPEAQNTSNNTLWHEIITKIIPWELFFMIFEGFYAVSISRKIRNSYPEIISEYFFVSNTFVSEGSSLYRYRSREWSVNGLGEGLIMCIMIRVRHPWVWSQEPLVTPWRASILSHSHSRSGAPTIPVDSLKASPSVVSRDVGKTKRPVNSMPFH